MDYYVVAAAGACHCLRPMAHLQRGVVVAAGYWPKARPCSCACWCTRHQHGPPTRPPQTRRPLPSWRQRGSRALSGLMRAQQLWVRCTLRLAVQLPCAFVGLAAALFVTCDGILLVGPAAQHQGVVGCRGYRPACVAAPGLCAPCAGGKVAALPARPGAPSQSLVTQGTGAALQACAGARRAGGASPGRACLCWTRSWTTASTWWCRTSTWPGSETRSPCSTASRRPVRATRRRCRGAAPTSSSGAPMFPPCRAGLVDGLGLLFCSLPLGLQAVAEVCMAWGGCDESHGPPS